MKNFWSDISFFHWRPTSGNESLNSDVQQFHQYKQNKHSHTSHQTLTINLEGNLRDNSIVFQYLLTSFIDLIDAK